jgi:hypothetical protein
MCGGWYSRWGGGSWSFARKREVGVDLPHLVAGLGLAVASVIEPLLDVPEFLAQVAALVL